MWYSLSCLDERCSVKVFLCLIKHEKKDKVKLENKEKRRKCGLKGYMSQQCQSCKFVG